MATVVLRGADLALLSDPVNVRVTLPHLIAAPRAIRYAGTLVTFAGDTLPTAFRGTSQSRSWQMTCVFGHAEHAQLRALVDLLDRAAVAADSRLLLRTHIGAVGGLDPLSAVAVFGYDATPEAGAIARVQFTADAVAWTEGV